VFTGQNAILNNSLLYLYANFAGEHRHTCRAQTTSAARAILIRKVLMQVKETQLWEELYIAAVLESDAGKIGDRINLAQDALRERWHELRRTPLARDPERQRVADAIRTLNLIRLNEVESPPPA
jgi:hypothetical protein